MRDPSGPWWERPGLEVRDGRLLVAGRDAEELARGHGTPLFVYDLERLEEQACSLLDAFERAHVPFRLRLALKAQRDPQVLAFVRQLGSVGIDASSPGEVLHALEHGWAREEISYTGTNVSERDLDVLLAQAVHLNVDLVSQLARVGRRSPGASIGIRVNPRAGASWSGSSSGSAGESVYAGATPTKFGILEEQLDEAIQVARMHGLVIDTVHAHVGDGFLTDALPQLDVAIERLGGFVLRLREAGFPIAEVNVGGGLGVPQRAEDEPLDPDAYAAVLVRHLGGLDVTIACEPGDFLAKEMGVLLAEIVTVDERDAVTFVGLDAGYNVAPERFIYGSPLVAVLCRAADARAFGPVTLAGNINEGDDLWVEHLPLPEVEEGDIVALLGVGTYNQSMHLDHCLRPPAAALAFADRIATPVP
jgi:diaminopimelate decarboxylase